METQFKDEKNFGIDNWWVNHNISKYRFKVNVNQVVVEQFYFAKEFKLYFINFKNVSDPICRYKTAKNIELDVLERLIFF